MASGKLPYVREVLPNGLVVLVYPMRDIWAAGIVLRLHTGNIYEKRRGLAHVVEHYGLSATESYPTPLKFREALEILGASWNGVTSNRKLEFFFHLPSSRLAEGLKIVSEVVFKPVFPEGELERVRGIVTQEWRDRHDKPDFRFYQRMGWARFGDRNHVYVRDESLELLKSFTVEDVKRFYEKFFHPNQMVLGIGGGVEVAKTLKLVKKLFGGYPAGKFIGEPKVDAITYGQKEVICHEEKSEQAHFELTFPAYGWRKFPEEKRVASELGVRILGAGRTSRLYKKLRLESGLVYDVSSGLDMYPYLGYTSIDSTCSVDKLAEVLKIVRTEVNAFVQNGPTEQEVEMAKQHLIGRLETGFEGSMSVARYFVNEEFDQEGIMLLEDRIKMVKALTRAKIWKMTRDLFDWSEYQFGLMNDYKKLSKDDFRELAKKTFAQGL